MKMNNETIDFIDLFYTYEKFGYVDRKEKVLAQLRFWLRYVLYRYYGPSRKDEMEEVFKWIWSAPVNEWNAMVVCVTRSNCQTLGEIKKLYEFLK